MVYTHTDIGHKRSENQDSTGVAVLDGAVFAVVCDGMGGFYSGYCSCILTDCVNSGFQVLFYDALRRRYLRHKSREGEEMRVGVAGAVKGSSARRSRWPPPRA